LNDKQEGWELSTEGTRRKSKKKEVLILAAEELFTQKGIRQVSVEEIVRNANVSKATFYKYFTDKKDILEHTLQRAIDAVIKDFQVLLEKGKQHRMTKEDFLKIFDMNEYDKLFQSGLLIELLQDYPEIVEGIQEWYQDNLMPLFYDLIRMAKVDGIVRMDVDTEVLIIYMQSIRNPKIREDSPILQRMSFKEFNKKYMDFFLYGVMVRDNEIN
jgi:AcrR family transcriptional regulator